MARIKGGVKTRSKHKKVLKLAKGYRMSRGKQIKKAKESILHAGEYAYKGRKLKKRQFRRLWITRINAALRAENVKYSQFIRLLKVKKLGLDRKILAKIAAEYPGLFKSIVEKIK